MVSLDLYTQNIPLTQKAKFWTNYVSSLKGNFSNRDEYQMLEECILSGNQDLRANESQLRTWHPSVIETLPNDYPELKMEFTKLESQMFDRPMRRAHEPLTPVIADANERYFVHMQYDMNHWSSLDKLFIEFFFRINSMGYSYSPVHTDIYGTYRPGGATKK